MGKALARTETEMPAPMRGTNGAVTDHHLLGRMQRNRGALGPPTVCRALNGLEQAGLVRRIETLRARVPATPPAPGAAANCGDCAGGKA